MFLFETLQKKKKQKPDLFRKVLLLFGGFLHDGKIFIFTKSIFNLLPAAMRLFWKYLISHVQDLLQC